MSYFTDSVEALKLIDGRIIRINTDPERYYWLRKPTFEELRGAIESYNQFRINLAWSELADKVWEDEALSCLRLFRKGLRLGFIPVRVEALQAFFPERVIPGKGLLKWLKNVPLDEQKAMAAVVRPNNLTEVHRLFHKQEALTILPTDLTELLDMAGSVDEFMTRLIDLTYGKYGKNADQMAPDQFPQQLIDLVNYARSGGKLEGTGLPKHYTGFFTFLREKNWLLHCFLHPARAMNKNIFAPYTEQHNYIQPKRQQLMDDISALTGGVVNRLESSVRQVFMLSEIDSHEDLHAEAINFVEQLFDRWTRANQVTNLSRLLAGELLCKVWNRNHPDQAIDPSDYRPAADSGEKDYLRGSPTFKWVLRAFPDRPEMVRWVEICANFAHSRKARRNGNVVNDLNHFLTFLATLPVIPADPQHVVRRMHIHDVTGAHADTTLRRYLEKMDLVADSKNDVLLEVKRLFDYYHSDYLKFFNAPGANTFVNPIDPATDCFAASGKSAGQKTPRDALPPRLIEEIKKTITDNDFAFPKKDQASTVIVPNQETGQLERVWYPGLAIALYILLDEPIRVAQVRWLDDGEWDEEILGFDERQQPILTPNPKLSDPELPRDRRRLIEGRRQFALRQFTSMLEDDDRQLTGMFINTNKTDFYDGTTPNGYLLPYVSPEAQRMIQDMRDWNRKYLSPLEAPIPYLTGEGLNPDVADKMPLVSPLFRDPRKNRQGKTDTPLRYGSLRNFYIRVLRETERRMRAEGNRHIRLIKHSVDENGNDVYVPKYDLHTLRVSGITNLIQKGVPIEVVSQFVVDHATLMMTLHYLKHDPGYLHDLLAKAVDQFEEDQSFFESDRFVQHFDEFKDFFLHNDSIPGRPSEAISKLRNNHGSWEIFPDGICPGTSCMDGFEYEDEDGKVIYGPVPGGKTCSLCRYWLTGPMFLLGQVAKANSLLYQIDCQGRERKERLEEIRHLKANGHLKRAEKLRGRIRELDEQLALDLNDWRARYLFAVASSTALQDYLLKRDEILKGEPSTGTDDTQTALPILTRNSDEGLKVVIAKTHRFVQLDAVVQSAQFITGFKHDQAVLDHQRLLSRILYLNDLQPFLLGVDDQEALVAGNLMSSWLLKYAGPQNIAKLLHEDPTGQKLYLREVMVTKESGEVASLYDEIKQLETQLGQLPRVIPGHQPFLSAQQNAAPDHVFGE